MSLFALACIPVPVNLYQLSAQVGAVVPRRREKWLFFLCTTQHVGFPRGSAVKNLPANAGDVGLSLGMGRFPEEEMAARSSLLAWRIPWTEEPAAAAAAKLLQSCPTLCDPIDGSPPGSPVPGILQARTLKWVAISFSNA